MPAGGRPTVRSRRLGAALRRYREAAKLDQQHAADHIASSKAKISRVEAGQVSARPGDVRLMLELYGVEDRGVYTHLEQLARDSNKRGWWLDYAVPDGLGDYIALETDATYIRTWQPLLIPGLLQTEGYTRSLLEGNAANSDPAFAEQVVNIRQERRKKAETSGARFAAVVGESTITSALPSRAAHRAQLADLIESSERANVTLQVLPGSEWAATRCSPGFVMLSFDGEWSPTAIGQDTHSSIFVAEDPEEIAAYAHSFELLRSTALNPAESKAFIRQAMNDLPEESTEQ
ncbi:MULTISPECIES: helix-turn-helix transcriptional regulator [unclassified Streptomyces]|uniref:helix-turn-helix domain-containing protein n=1 Tax=unclassified Streptomyces TaxID=2593676 RepID=UPI0032492BBA